MVTLRSVLWPEVDYVMDVSTMSLDDQMAYLTRGVVEVISEGELREKLEKSRRIGKPLTVKVGFDPTAPDLHLGHTVLLRKMRHFQDLGHVVIFLIGDFTGMIGDPSGRSKTRPLLTRADILKNVHTYKTQVFKILDPQRTMIDFNSRWLASLSSEEWLRLCGRYTVARMLERDDFAKRLASSQPISIHELLYPLAQAYDSVVLRADLELGGTDQKFNLLVGRDIQRAFGQEPQVLLMTPILEGVDGVEKMSKSLGNYVGIDDPPREIYGKLMSISDELMWRYLELLTDVSSLEISRRRKEVVTGRCHPMKVKEDLAFVVVQEFHSESAAHGARRHFARVFRQKERPEEIPLFRVSSSSPLLLVDLICRVGFASSKSEARRLIRQGGVSINGEKVTDPAYWVPLDKSELLLRVGRRRFSHIRFSA